METIIILKWMANFSNCKLIMKKIKKIIGIIALSAFCFFVSNCSGGESDGPEKNPTTHNDNSGAGNQQGNNSGGSNNGTSGHGVATAFSGDGSKQNPYLISGTPELRKLSKDVNEGNTYQGKYFRMTNDIIFNSNVLNSNGRPNISDKFEEWTPIGCDSKCSFCGSFDGNGYSISGIYINQGEQENLGLFGFLSGEVKNLTIKDSYLRGRLNIGGIAGSVLTFTSNPVIINCRNYTCIQAEDHAGGIFGYNEDSPCVIDRCSNYGIISGGGNLAGIAGFASKTTIKNCANYGLIGNILDENKHAWYLAGIVSFGRRSSGLKIYNCVNFGDLKGNDSRSGICVNYPDSIANCVNYGKVYYGICEEVNNTNKVVKTYFLNIACESGIGVKRIYSSSQCKEMSGVEMQSKEFLDQLNGNARTLGSDYAKWRFGKEGFPELEI